MEQIKNLSLVESSGIYDKNYHELLTFFWSTLDGTYENFKVNDALLHIKTAEDDNTTVKNIVTMFWENLGSPNLDYSSNRNMQISFGTEPSFRRTLGFWPSNKRNNR